MLEGSGVGVFSGGRGVGVRVGVHVGVGVMVGVGVIVGVFVGVGVSVAVAVGSGGALSLALLLPLAPVARPELGNHSGPSLSGVPGGM